MYFPDPESYPQTSMNPPDPGRSRQRGISAENFLDDPDKSDEISLVKVGQRSDPHSLMALYRNEDRDDGIISVNPQLDGFLVSIVLEDMKGFTILRNKKVLHIPPCQRGTIGIHDLRNSWSAPAFTCYSAHLVFSSPFLRGMRPGGRSGAMDLLQESLAYQERDETLLHIAMALLPSLRKPSWANRLFVDQMFLAASTHLIWRSCGHEPLATLRGGLTPRQEKIAKEYLSSNLGSDVSLEEVARLCDLSPPQFSRLFKKSTGNSAYRWYLDQRLALAKSLLATTQDELAKIALVCGFADQSHFTRTFSRIVGLSPGTWRRLEQ
jgi:AraC family transcriptional regulator